MTTPDEKLAEMAGVVVASRKRELAETLALQILASTGSVDQETLNARLAAEWVEPSEAALRDTVTAKAAAAVDYHERAAVAAEAKVAGARSKTDRLRADLADAEAVVADLEAADEAGAERVLKDEFQAAYDAAVAAGGQATPPGGSAAARADVAGAVGDALASGR